eukprot:GEMP01007266.1.p1 GENE.GEMP01007266.1~~GEMP01007266.1.p1  ORF type:complete len:1029 (+),score=218.85 GEMP01007266.1:329-3415(+)
MAFTSMSQIQHYQQQHINSMLEMLPDAEKKEIEDMVKQYREDMQPDLDEPTKQYYVWQYYSQAVMAKYAHHVQANPMIWQTSAAAPSEFATPSASSTSILAHNPTGAFQSAYSKTPSVAASSVIQNALLNAALNNGEQQKEHSQENETSATGDQGNAEQDAPAPKKPYAADPPAGDADATGATDATDATDASAAASELQQQEQIAAQFTQLQQMQQEQHQQPTQHQEFSQYWYHQQYAQQLAEAGRIHQAQLKQQNEEKQQKKEKEKQEKDQKAQEGFKSFYAQHHWTKAPAKAPPAQSWSSTSAKAAPQGSKTTAPKSAPVRPIHKEFPKELQKWIENVYVNCKHSGGYDTKTVHKYLRLWINHYVQSKELKTLNWTEFPVPTPSQMANNVAPHLLKGSESDEKPKEFTPTATRRRRFYDSRSRSSRSRSRSPKRQRGRSFSSSPSRSQHSSYSTKAAQEARREDNDWSGSWNDNDWHEEAKPAKGSKKGGWKGWKGGGKTYENLVEYLTGRIESQTNWHKEQIAELQQDIKAEFQVWGKQIRVILGEPLGTWVYKKLKSNKKGKGKGWGKAQKYEKWWDAEEEEWKKNDRAHRFQDHLGETVQTSFDDCEEISIGGILGTLETMSSTEEAKEREATRQLDRFEYSKGCDFKNPTANLALCCKKYQRSSADKSYKAKETRTLKACWKTMEFLMVQILDFEVCPKVEFALTAKDINYFEIYAYLRDRTRAVRVDLHVQQPNSTTTQIYIESHEACLRFELLSMFLCRLNLGIGKDSQGKYDDKLGMKAISQTIEPLLFAYNSAREAQAAKELLRQTLGEGEDDDDDLEIWISPVEPCIHRFVILLLISSPDKLLLHLNKLQPEDLKHPLVVYALDVFAAYQSENYQHFLQLYKTSDFLSAVAMSPVVDIVRLRVLGVLAKAPAPSLQDSIHLETIMSTLGIATVTQAIEFLKLAGLKVVNQKVTIPKRENLQIPLSGSLPNDAADFKCLGADLKLYQKYCDLKMPRKDIVLGYADPRCAAPENGLRST